MCHYRIAPVAEDDIESILVWTLERFGRPATDRYEALVIRAITAVSEKPGRLGSLRRPEIAENAITYHLSYSRNRVSADVGRVKQPRHFLLYRVLENVQVEIGRVLHESMDLERHLPPEYRA